MIKVMRFKTIHILSILTLTLLVGCEEALNEKVSFDMTVSSEGSSIRKDTVIVKKSTDVVFDFSGNPDFISFYSGENGHEYSKRNLVESPVDKINSMLTFSVKTQYGSAATVEGSLKVLLSTEFTGLFKEDKKVDSINVEKTGWVDVTNKCGIPQEPGVKTDILSLPLNDYLGKRLTLAFLYNPKSNSATQPVWEIYDLKIVNSDKTTQEIVGQIKANDFGFTPLDMNALTDAYKTVSNNTEGVWNTSNASASPSTIRIHSSGTGRVIHKDWLISNPIIINGRSPDTGASIKTITNRVDSYSYKYSKTGVYTATMIGRKDNFESASEIIKEVVLKVID